jgi:hypothetical protein
MNKPRGFFNYQETHSRVIETEAEERQLEVEVLMDLLIRSVDIALQISLVFRASLVKEPVHKVPADLLQTCLGNGVASSVISVRWRFTRGHTIHRI